MKLPRLRVSQLRKQFPAVEALRGVSFSAKSREILALLGPNGAGKSTLISILAGVIQPTSGNIFIDEKKTILGSPARAIKTGIRAVHQDPAVMGDLRVWDHFCFAGFAHSHPLGILRPATARRAAKEALERIGATFSVDCLVSTLDPGDRTLLEIARAVGERARVLLFDEPGTAMRSRDRQSVGAALRYAASMGACVILVTHDWEDARILADRVITLDAGQIQDPRAETLSDVPRFSYTSQPHTEHLFDNNDPQPRTPVMRMVNVLSTGLGPIDLELRPGEILGLAGYADSGVRQLPRVLAGLHHIQTGTIYIAGIPTQPQVRRFTRAGVHYMSRDRANDWLFPELTVRDNLTAASYMQLAHFGLWRDVAREREQALQYTGRLRIATAHINGSVTTLSGGNQQKVVLARAIAASPRVLILDEPFSGLDRETRDEVHVIIKELALDGATIVLVAREFDELSECSHRVLCLSRGTIIGTLTRPRIHPPAIVAYLESDLRAGITA